jgi:hypothetical protein
MANWLASRCDNTSETYVVNLGDLSGEIGMVISAPIEGGDICLSLIEESISEAKITIGGGPYDSCIQCFNNLNQVIGFASCFDKIDFTIPTTDLKELPQVNKVYDVDVTIPSDRKGGEDIIIKGCFTYVGYNEVKPPKNIRFNSAIIEFDSCEKCSPYKSNLISWGERVGKTESFNKLRDNYTNIFK